jgi:hypothetical protein
MMENSYHWIQVWIQNYNDWSQNVKDHSNDIELRRRELALQKLIKTSHKSIEDYPRILAAWARVAADFPTFTITVQSRKMELADYWESIIVKCAKEETIFQIPEADLNELVEHCEDELVGDGSLNAISLMRYLRKGQAKQRNFLGLGDIDLASKSGTAYRILKPNESAEDANIQNMIDSAPDKEPNKKDYTDLISYIKAKARWNIKSNYSILQNAHNITTTVEPNESNNLNI